MSRLSPSSFFLGLASAVLLLIVACQTVPPTPKPDFNPPAPLVKPVDTSAEVQKPIDAATVSGAAAQAANNDTGKHISEAEMFTRLAQAEAAERKAKDLCDKALAAMAAASTSNAVSEARVTDMLARLNEATAKNAQVTSEQQRFAADAMAMQLQFTKQLADAAAAKQAADAAYAAELIKKEKAIQDLKDIQKQNELKAQMQADKLEAAWWADKSHILLIMAGVLGLASVAAYYFAGALSNAPLIGKAMKFVLLLAGLFAVCGAACQGISMHIKLAGTIELITAGVLAIGILGFVIYELIGGKKIQAVAHAAEIKAKDAALELEQKAKDQAHAVLDAIADVTARADLDGDGIFSVKDANVAADRIGVVAGHEARALFVEKFCT